MHRVHYLCQFVSLSAHDDHQHQQHHEDRPECSGTQTVQVFTNNNTAATAATAPLRRLLFGTARIVSAAAAPQPNIEERPTTVLLLLFLQFVDFNHAFPVNCFDVPFVLFNHVFQCGAVVVQF
jgi:hypothetical protein